MKTQNYETKIINHACSHLTVGCNQPNEAIDSKSFTGLWKMHTIEQLDSLSGQWQSGLR